MSEKTFKHSGALGDIIYSLGTIKALGGGVLYLDVSGGADDEFVQKQSAGGTTRFDLNGYETIRPLLMEQEYVQDVRVWRGESVDINFNAIRETISDTNVRRTFDLYAERFCPGQKVSDEPWLTLRSEPIKLGKDIIINRTARYQQKYLHWEASKKQWLERSVFVGLEIEHRVFEQTFDCKINYYPARDALEIARVLMGARQLVANQSCVMAIAIGLGISFVQEKYDFRADCVFQRTNGQYF